MKYLYFIYNIYICIYISYNIYDNLQLMLVDESVETGSRLANGHSITQWSNGHREQGVRSNVTGGTETGKSVLIMTECWK